VAIILCEEILNIRAPKTQPESQSLQEFVIGIQKTGYPLEAKTVQILQRRGWTVISNKYYVDNDEEKPREVDVIAYKADTAHADFDLYTALIISCKKSENSSWAFLTRESNLKDPNADWQPVHFFVQHPGLEFMFKDRKKWAVRYHEAARDFGVSQVLNVPEVEVFALQEMQNPGNKNKISGAPNGDSQMFNSVMSLMKAQFYEMAVRRDISRIKPVVYQFNLLSLADARFVRLHFSEDSIVPSDVQLEHYIARYIFNKAEIFSRIVFTRSDVFEHLLEDYNKLHNANREILSAQVAEFYKDIVTDPDRMNVLKEAFSKGVERRIRAASYGAYQPAPLKIEISFLYWNKSESILQIDSGATEEELVFLNGDKIRAVTSSLLKSIYHYDGKFEFTNDIPF
jgi:hypothetical protein